MESRLPLTVDWARLARLRGWVVPLTCLVIVVYLSATTSTFFTDRNIFNLLDQWAPVLILTCGATIVIISGGFDLSAGAVFGVGGVVAVALANAHGLAVAFAGTIAFGIAVGALNGILVSWLRVHSFLVTLASGLIVKGIALTALAGSAAVISDDPAFRDVARTEWGDLTLPVVVAVAILAVLGVALARTVIGEQLYAVGGNAPAALAAGVRVAAVRVTAFAASGALAGIAGLIAASRASSGRVSAGDGLEFLAITAAVIGGVSILGGRGSTWQAALGLLLLALIGNGINLSDIDATYQQVIVGALLVVVLAIDARGKAR